MKLKYLCSSFSTSLAQSAVKSEGLYKVYGASGLVGYLDEYEIAVPYLGIVKDGAGVGRVRKYDEYSSLLSTLAYIVPNERANIDWLKYVIQSLDLGGNADKTTIPHVYFSDYGNRDIRYVDLYQQQRIANFLDDKCARIDSVIEKTRASIDEYKKLKQAVITRAVTRGIRPARPTKFSGVDWLGEVPDDWEISKMKYVADLQPTCDTSKLTEESEITYTPMDCIKNGYFINNTALYGKVAALLTPYIEGDIVIAKVTPCFENGNIAVMENLASGFGLGSSELFVIRPRLMVTRYLFYWLQNNLFMQQGCATMTGTGGLKRVSLYFVRNSFLPRPPLDEQKEIAAYLDEKTAAIDSLIAKKNQLASELERLKKSLIFEYVTGKKELAQ